MVTIDRALQEVKANVADLLSRESIFAKKSEEKGTSTIN